MKTLLALLLSLPAAASAASGGFAGAASAPLPSDRDAALASEIRKTLADRRYFDKDDGAGIAWAHMAELPGMEDYARKLRCGAVGRLQPNTLRGAAALVYLQRRTALELARRELDVAAAAVRGAENASGLPPGAIAKPSPTMMRLIREKEAARRLMLDLRLDVESLEHLLPRNGWAETRSSPLTLPALIEKDYVIHRAGARC